MCGILMSGPKRLRASMRLIARRSIPCTFGRIIRLPSRKDKSMKNKIAVVGPCLAVAFPLLAQKKEDQRLADSATVMKELSQGDNGLPKSVLNQAMCVLVFPSVKKVAVGIGGSYGRGVLVCRKGAKMDGAWGAPVMYALDQGSIGVQLG